MKAAFNRPAVRSYGLALVATATALGLRWLLDPWLQGHYPLTLLYVAVAVIVWRAGVRPAVLAATVGYAAASFLFIEPRYSLELQWPADQLGLAFYALACATVVLLGHRIMAARRAADETLRVLAERESRLALTLRAISDAFYILDREWRYTYINSRATRYFGEETARKMYGRTIWEMRPRLVGTVVESEYRRAVAERVPVQVTYRSTMSGRWVEARAYPLPDGLAVFFLDIHERKQAEEAARLAEQRLREVTNSVPALISYIDRDARYQFNNRAYEDWFGVPAETVIGRHVSEVLGPAAWEIVRPRLEEALAGRRVTYEAQITTANGRRRWVQASYVPRFDADGAVDGVFTLVTDVSERKALEEELRAREELLRLAERAANAGSWHYDAGSGRKEWSEQCHLLYGTDPASFQPTLDTWAGLILEEDRAAALDAVARAVREARDFDVEFRIRHPRHGLRWLWEIGRAESQDGRVVRISGITVDITQRKKVEHALRESEAHFRTIADTVPSMIYLTDASGRCVYITRQWYEYTGRTPEQDLGLGWLENIHPDDRAFVEATAREGMAERRLFHVDYRLRRRDGAYRWVVGSAAPKFSEHGTFEGYVGVVTDVHERKELERALQEADRRKDEFLALLGHELRNPLAPVRNCISVLQLAGDDPARRRTLLTVLDRQVANLTRLVDDLLDVGRIVSGKVELRRRRVDASELVREGIETALPQLEGLGHRITTALPTEPVFVDADPVRLTQVVSNLLNNAAKFTPHGGRIDVSLEREDGQARIAVRDNGIGIPADQLGAIFDMFVQAENASRDKQGGLGLGLTLVKRLVEMHGGSVVASSAGAGRGSEFVVRIPLAAEAGAAPAPLEPGAPSARRRFFIVDDNRDSAESLALLLDTLGQEAGTAFSGEEALEAIPGFRPDVVVCDISMPGLSGFQLAERLRAQPCGRSMVLVALTGFGGEEDRLRTAAAGFDAHFVKPVDPQALIAVQRRDAALLGRDDRR